MRFPSLRLSVVVLTLGVLMPAGAHAAHAATAPTVRTVKPLELRIGDKLTITGRGFLSGKGRTTVVFKREGHRAVFAKAQSATATRLVVEVPAKLAPFLTKSNGEPRPTRFRIRVLARRFADAYTATKRSPLIGGAAEAAPPAPVPAVDLDCDKDKITNDVDPDDDNDQLSDTLEVAIKTNLCLADSDADTLTDAFEYESALDLNARALPYPGKRPFPNALDATDANVDFDQDGLTQSEEHQLWLLSAAGTLPLTYSDGDQDTSRDGARTPLAGVFNGLDRDGDGFLTDDEKDADADLLTNWEETHGQMTIGWWPAAYSTEKHFVGRPGAATLFAPSFLDPDSDGDGLIDGLDDQDHDGFANRDELKRVIGQPKYHVYNPCLPDPDSRTCSLHPPLSDPWAPFGGALPAPGSLVLVS